VLPLLCAAAEQYDQTIAVFSEVDAVTWPKIQFAFVDARSHTLYPGKVALPYPCNRYGHLRSGLRIEAIEPHRVGTSASGVKVLMNFDRCGW
jgi:3-mercaptopyruvate sulfurtransferase SseA